ncbi:GNAT family N-acetyltransferase [Pseudomonas sp. N040]|uniref:GNAT family N-acetyltransferase n=1 Tax=Pseudomonas sp. N040 TaxID=2785325 RepID=UPI0018A28F32|nr:GNAT family N-acetyltransferase [Pseudomonas sp. N040]MBF7729579.1 GNAT family N-acetyltransferase [Pseudomonas sp. N040]MBW7013219.1 GNAT family N-acetyltransferase [Pseudomonas sp. N040]
MTAQQAAYQMSVMSRDELQIAMDWAQAEGWNPGLDDAAAFYAADPAGFLIGKLGTQPVATISAVKYGAAFGFIGLYIAQPSYRGQGYGLQLWDKALAYLRGRNVGLDGVLAQQDNYRKSGFRLAHRNIRFAGLAKPAVATPTPAVSLASLALDELHRYDRQFFPEQRQRFLERWISQPNAHALGIVDNARLVGYGVIRACHSGYKIGPLNAQSPELASELFDALAARVPAGCAIYLDTPEPNSRAIELALRNGMQPCFETARMYTGTFPALPLDKVFGITSFELG